MTSSFYVKNQATRPQIPQEDDSYDFGYGMEDDSFGGFETEDSFSMDGPEGEALPATTSELRKKLQEILGQLGTADMRKKEIDKLSEQIANLEMKINEAQGGDPKKRAAKLAPLAAQLASLEQAVVGVPDLDELPGGWGDDEAKPSEMTKEKVDFMIAALKSGEAKPTDKSKLKAEDIIKILEEALAEKSAGKPRASAAAYAEALEALGGEKDEKQLAEDNFGEKPKKIENGVAYFEGGKEGSLSLNAPGFGKTAVVDKAEEVKITPKNKSDEVSLSEEGDYYVVKCGNDTFKVHKDAKLRIFSDKVTGAVDNSDGSITIGATDKASKKFADPVKVNEVAGRIGTADITIGYQKGKHSTFGYGISEGGARGEKMKAGAKKVLNAISEAMRETDPKKQKEKMEYATEALDRLRNEFADDQGGGNDTAQLIFNVLEFELGDKGFKDALGSGLIPQDFADSLAKFLEIKADETNSQGEVGLQKLPNDRPSRTHGDSADYLRRNSKASSSD